MRKHILYAILLTTLISCNISDNVEVGDMQNMKFGGIKGNGIQTHVEIPIKNNNNAKIVVKEFDLEARVNGKFLGTVNCNDTIIIPRNSDAIYPITFNIEIKNILLGVQIMNQVINNKQLKGEISGHIKVTYLLLPRKIEVREKF